MLPMLGIVMGQVRLSAPGESLSPSWSTVSCWVGLSGAQGCPGH